MTDENTVLDITPSEEKVLMTIYELSRDTGKYIGCKSVTDVVGLSYKHVGVLMSVLKRMHLISAPKRIKTGRFKPTHKAIKWIQKHKLKGEEK